MEINYLAVLVAAIAANIIGGLWYSPVLFGNTWMKLMGWDPSNKVQMESMKKTTGKSYAINFVASIVMAYVLAHVVTMGIAYLNGSTGNISAALQGAFWSWLGFVVPVALSAVLWENKPWKLFLLNVGYYLVSLAIMGTILSTWR